MAKKVVKGGKKRKPGKVSIQAYDLEIISKNDLKMYVASLEKELALMRSDCAFYSANKDKVMEFLDAKRNFFNSQTRTSIVNNIALDDLVEQLRRFPEKYNEKIIVDDREEVRQRMEIAFDDFFTTKSAEVNHFDEERILKQNIADADRRLESGRFLYEMILADEKQSYQNAAEDFDVEYSNKMERTLQKEVDKILNTNQEFNADRIKTLTDIWDADERGETTESFASEVKRMQDFFHEIAFNNAEVMKMLREKLASLLIENKKTELNLNRILIENLKLKNSIQPASLLQAKIVAPAARASYSKRNVESEKKLNALQYRNEVLAQYLRVIKKDLQTLKSQFINAIRKIYQKAEFRALVIEELIFNTLQIESFEPTSAETELGKLDTPKTEPEIQNEDGFETLFRLSVENSDTLFVPPVYHKFWDPSLKYIKS